MSLIGERIDRYVITERLGSGGMGEVYRATDERLRRDVAVKLLTTSDADSADRQARLLREAQAAGALNHPGVVTIHDVGQWRDRVYLVMELVEGESLRSLARRGLTPLEAIALGRQAAAALAVAHERGVLHRDIKPENLMATSDGRVKVLDFGLAKTVGEIGRDAPPARVTSGTLALIDTMPTPPPEVHPPRAGPDDQTLAPRDPSSATPSSSATQTGWLVGTPAYMSPEQALGQPVDERSEVYAMGLVLHELLTGQIALLRPDLKATVEAARNPKVSPPSQVTPERKIPRAFDRVVLRATARSPEDRYQTMRHLERSLGRAHRRVRGRRSRIIAGAVGLAGVTSAVAAILIAGRDRDGARGPAPAPPITIAGVERITFGSGCDGFPTFWPDGRAVVFSADSDGDYEITRLDLATGEQRQLTSNAELDTAPDVSPDGRWISYIHYSERGRELLIMPWNDGAPGAARSVGTAFGFPRWGPDGNLYFGDNRGHLFMLDPGSPNSRQTIAELKGGLMAAWIAPLPDRRLLYGARLAGQLQSDLEVGMWSSGTLTPVEVRDIDSTALVGVVGGARGNGFYYSTMTAAGPRLAWRGLDDPEPFSFEMTPYPRGGMDVSPTGDAMVLSTCHGRRESGRLLPDGRFRRAGPAGDWDDEGIVLIADEVFAVSSNRSGQSRIWLVERTAAARLLIDQPAIEPAISPDRSTLAWEGVEPGPRGLFVSATDGSGRRQVTTDPTDQRPSFSHDGQRLLFMRRESDGVRLYAADLDDDDEDAHLVIPEPIVEYALSPAEDLFAVLRSRDGGRVVEIHRRGGQAQVIAGVEGGTYTTPTFSWDGRHLFMVRNRNEVVELSLVADKPPVVVARSPDRAIIAISPAPEGDGWLATVEVDEGSLYLARGRFR